MRNLKRVSRWITIQSKEVTKRSRLWDYADKEQETDEKAYVYYFRHGGREYAINQFLSRFGMMGFDFACEEYPSYITGYDGERYYDNLYCEIDAYGEKIRLYVEV